MKKFFNNQYVAGLITGSILIFVPQYIVPFFKQVDESVLHSVTIVLRYISLSIMFSYTYFKIYIHEPFDKAFVLKWSILTFIVIVVFMLDYHYKFISS